VLQWTRVAGPAEALALGEPWLDGVAVADAVAVDGDGEAERVGLPPHPAITSIKTRAAPLARTA
jgi:hypothetical protein